MVRFYDVDADHNLVLLNGLPSVRNFTRFIVEPSQPLDGPAIQAVVDEHVHSLSARIESELGLRVLPVADGRVDAPTG